MSIPGLRGLVEQLPEAAVPFEGSQFPFPISQVLFGGPPDIARLREQAKQLEISDSPPQDATWVALAAAEVIESAQSDRGEYFSRDEQFRGMVFSGIKWAAGWALMLGDDQQPYAQAFKKAGFMVSVTRDNVEPGRFLGERQTASVYFAQLLARYILLYSNVRAGERHEVTHFVEDHGPGVLVAAGHMKPVEALLSLSLMKLGMPAIVTLGFPWEVGNRVLVEDPEQAVAATQGFQNLRIRSQDDPLTALPEYANPASAREKFDPASRLGGSDPSFFSLRRGTTEEGIEVTGKPKHGIGILVTIEDDTLDAPAGSELEKEAIGYLNLLPGLRVESGDPLAIALKTAGAPTAEQMADVVRRGLRLEYPRLGPIHVAVIGDANCLRSMVEDIKAERASRAEAIECLSKAAPDVIYSCESCAAFTREHICFTHPVRAPMCGRRWTEMLVGARYMAVSGGRPWRCRGRPENCCAAVPLGRCLDPLKGEYEGLNQFVRQATNGRMQRVFLHSVREFPHSSCGCFGALAWWSDEMGGIGIMHRGFRDSAPDGSAWNVLANRAGGKQQPGITGIAIEYMSSPTFLQGDGGWRAVKWMTSKLQEELRHAVPSVAHVPTEKG